MGAKQNLLTLRANSLLKFTSYIYAYKRTFFLRANSSSASNYMKTSVISLEGIIGWLSGAYVGWLVVLGLTAL